jgi:DNA-binding MarR family transcriptional regulator
MEKELMHSDLYESHSYIVKDTMPERAYGIFNRKIISGCKGLCVTRTHPSEIKRLYNLDVPVFWLANQKDDDSAVGTINDLKTRVKDFIKKTKKAIVLIDRIDYLVNMHGFPEFMRMLYSLNDDVLASKSILMLNVNPHVLNPSELALLEQELRELPKPKSNSDIELSDDLYEIMTYVNYNDKATFKMVSKEFQITKTTTRKRINKLLVKSLVTIKKNGRNKVIRITESGKSLL